jgi:hypothetical protein
MSEPVKHGLDGGAALQATALLGFIWFAFRIYDAASGPRDSAISALLY